VAWRSTGGARGDEVAAWRCEAMAWRRASPTATLPAIFSLVNAAISSFPTPVLALLIWKLLDPTLGPCSSTAEMGGVCVRQFGVEMQRALC